MIKELSFQFNPIESLTENQISKPNHSSLLNLVPNRFFIQFFSFNNDCLFFSALFIRFNMSSSIWWTPAADLNSQCWFEVFPQSDSKFKPIFTNFSLRLAKWTDFWLFFALLIFLSIRIHTKINQKKFQMQLLFCIFNYLLDSICRFVINWDKEWCDSLLENMLFSFIIFFSRFHVHRSVIEWVRDSAPARSSNHCPSTQLRWFTVFNYYPVYKPESSLVSFLPFFFSSSLFQISIFLTRNGFLIICHSNQSAIISIAGIRSFYFFLVQTNTYTLSTQIA